MKIHPCRKFPALLVGCVALSPLSSALADFSGSDSLENKSANWAELLLQGICFLREAPERANGTDRRAGKWGLFSSRRR